MITGWLLLTGESRGELGERDGLGHALADVPAGPVEPTLQARCQKHGPSVALGQAFCPNHMQALATRPRQACQLKPGKG